MDSANHFYCKVCCLVIISITISSYDTNALTEQKSMHLLVVLPLSQDGNELTASWERGKEILLGAAIALEAINNNSDIISGHKPLNVTLVDTGKCSDDNFNYIIQLINSISDQNVIVLGIVGMFCPFKLQHILKPPLQKETFHLALHPLYRTECWSKFEEGSVMVKALEEFFIQLKWRKFGIITEAGDTFFSYLAEEVYRDLAHNLNVTISVHQHDKYIENVGNHNLPRILLVSVGAKSAVDLLCNAYQNNLTWPKYVWIFHSYQLEDFQSNSTCSLSKALENVLLFREEFQSFYGLSSQYNAYSVWLHDAILSVAIGLSELVQLEAGNTSHMSVKSQIHVVQVRNFTESIVAVYSNKLVFLEEMFKTRAPSDERAEAYEGGSLVYTFILAGMISLGCIFTTLMLTGYIYFRHEPEVKSTSFSLSLLVFFGCYLTLIYLSLNLHLQQPSPNEELSVLCFALHLFSGLGIPSALILATVAVKMIRVYYIFNKQTPKKLSQKCSDFFLFLYVMLMLTPMLLVYIIWTLLDPYTGFYQHIDLADLDMTVVQKGCTSAHLTLWQSILVLYTVSLFFMLLILALMMRKIQHKHFKDTKKVNILIICLFLDLFLTLVTWRVLYGIVKVHVADILLHIGHHVFCVKHSFLHQRSFLLTFVVVGKKLTNGRKLNPK